MGYVDENLISGETITYRGRLHWLMLVWPGVVAVLIAHPLEFRRQVQERIGKPND